MANYISAGRSNYFEVADEEAFAKWFSHMCGVEKFEIETDDGTHLFGFGCHGTPWYSNLEGSDEDAEGTIYCDESIAEIQSFIAEDHALIYMEAGWEKLRYVNGWSLIVTKGAFECIGIAESSVETARKLLGNESYSPQMGY